ncbi:conserved hypothetical protein [Clostridium botulinum NCTC 2916]|nr:conserved hypothetical protein [Clostridium botulinum F str. 230613]EDT81722.1 conserved hypothetical protein [Clostridium botulinum NCTC 2916]
MSTTISPVTQTEDVDVNRQSKKGVLCPLCDEIGKLSNTAPTNITIAKPIANI